MRSALAAALLVLSGAASDLAGQERSGGEAWAIEAAGGVLGSAAGFGVGLALVDDDCGDDLICIFTDVAAVLAMASGGSALGAWGLGRAADTDPSLGGAIVGSLAGAVASLGTLKLVDEIAPEADDRATAVITVSLTQGAITALGSMLGAALR